MIVENIKIGIKKLIGFFTRLFKGKQIEEEKPIYKGTNAIVKFRADYRVKFRDFICPRCSRKWNIRFQNLVHFMKKPRFKKCPYCREHEAEIEQTLLAPLGPCLPGEIDFVIKQLTQMIEPICEAFLTMMQPIIDWINNLTREQLEYLREVFEIEC